MDLCMCLGSSIQAVFLQLLGDEAEIPQIYSAQNVV